MPLIWYTFDGLITVIPYLCNPHEYTGCFTTVPARFPPATAGERDTFVRSTYFQLTGLTGSATTFVAAGAWELASSVNHLFILNDREEAAYFHNDLESITQGLDIFYFPDSFKKAGFFNEINSSHSMPRTEALMKFSGNAVHKKVLITYPEALWEKVAASVAYTGNMVQLKVGDVLKVDDLLDKLVSWGFEFTDFVYEPGQYALRGGILDIYSFGNENLTVLSCLVKTSTLSVSLIRKVS